MITNGRDRDELEYFVRVDKCRCHQRGKVVHIEFQMMIKWLVKTREIRIKDSIRQGGVQSVLQYALLIDEINKEITKKNLGTYVGSLEEKIGCLLWMDDVLLISSEPKELQLMLEITNALAGKYHIEFGEEKSNVMKIGRSKNNPEFTLGDMNLRYTDKYKYLGYIQNNKNNIEDHIKALKGKVENAYQTLLAIAGNKNFNNIEMQTMWGLTHSKNQQDHGQHHKKNINGTTEYPQGSAVHWNRVAGSKSNKTKKPSAHGAQASQRQQSTDEKAHNKQHHNIKVGWRNEKSKRTTWNRWKGHERRKATVKNRITNRVKDWFKAKIEKESHEKSKIQHLLVGSRPALSSKPEQECCQWKTTTETNTGTILAEHVACRWRPKSMSWRTAKSCT